MNLRICINFCSGIFGSLWLFLPFFRLQWLLCLRSFGPVDIQMWMFLGGLILFGMFAGDIGTYLQRHLLKPVCWVTSSAAGLLGARALLTDIQNIGFRFSVYVLGVVPAGICCRCQACRTGCDDFGKASACWDFPPGMGQGIRSGGQAGVGGKHAEERLGPWMDRALAAVGLGTRTGWAGRTDAQLSSEGLHRYGSVHSEHTFCWLPPCSWACTDQSCIPDAECSRHFRGVVPTFHGCHWLSL